MSIEVKVPPLPGDKVRRDENLVDLETDKVVLEVPAPADGVLVEILAQEGDTVTAGQVLARLDEQAAAASAPAAAAPVAEPAPTPPAAAAAAPTNTEDLSPAVRRLIAEHGLDPAQIPATGRGGRLTKEDVLNYMEASTGSAGDSIRPRGTSAAAPEAQPARIEPEAPAQPAVQVQQQPVGERTERRVPMTRLRQRIAERLVEAQQTAALLTTFNEVNMKPVMDLRAKYRDQFEKAHGVKLGFMSFFVKASVEALKRFPVLNASVDGSDIIYHGYYDIGIAVSTPRGLVVPIIRDADRLSLADIEKAVLDYGSRAREGKLSIDELSGGTFSITNGGVFGSLMSTPILNPPQSAILGMHAIKERPVVENGEIVIRPMMYLALTYDHRIIDGREAVSALVTIKEMIEDPARLLLEL